MKSSCILFFLLFAATSSFSQDGKYKPFKLIIISPDSAVIDTLLNANSDSLRRWYQRDYYAAVMYAEDVLKKKHARDSTLKKHFIEGEGWTKLYIDYMKSRVKEVKAFKYYNKISNFSAFVYYHYFNEYPPYSSIEIIPKTSLSISNLRYIADSLNADYIIGFKNIHTERQKINFVLKFTTILFSKKDHLNILETESSGDDQRSQDGIWTCMDPLNCLLSYAVKSSTERVIDVLNKRQLAEYKNPVDDLSGPYPILSRTFEVLKYRHINNYNDESLYIILINNLDSIFQLGLKVIKDEKGSIVYYNDRKFRINDRDDFFKFCSSIRSPINTLFSKLHFDTDYDYYLADLLVFKIDRTSYVVTKEIEFNNTSRLTFTVNKNNDFIITEECRDKEHNTIRAGSIITELNSIPIKYFTFGTVNNLLYRNRSGYIEIQLKGSRPTIIEPANCNLNTAQGFEYMIDYQGTCYIKFNSYLDHQMTNKFWELLTADCDSINNIILDLRFGLGGRIGEAMDLANLFTKRGLLFIELITKGPDTARYYSMNYNKCEGKPMYIFINRMTSTAGQIIASILKEYRGATLIGDMPMSNSSFLVTYALSKNYNINICDGIFRTANKYLFNGEPIQPDISFDSPEFRNLNLTDYK